jgi:hypothetical protein
MKKAFVPICLYSNGFFLVKDNLRFFLHVFSDYSELLFVIVDKLYGNNLLIKDKVLDVEQAEKAYKERGEHIFSHVKNTIRDYAESHHIQTKYQICRWNDIADRKDYVKLLNKVLSVFDSNLNLKYYSDMFIVHNLTKMTNIITPSKIELERDYLFGEIAMSIYLTEILGYNNEFWEKPQSEYLPDPLDILYNEERESLSCIIDNKESIRVQQYLSPIFNEYIERFGE